MNYGRGSTRCVELAQPLYIYCLTGIRSYLAYRILDLNGFR